MTDQEAFVEAGIVAFGSFLLSATPILVFGRMLGDLQRGRRHGAAPPARGVVPGSRHHNITSAAPR